MSGYEELDPLGRHEVPFGRIVQENIVYEQALNDFATTCNVAEPLKQAYSRRSVELYTGTGDPDMDQVIRDICRDHKLTLITHIQNTYSLLHNDLRPNSWWGSKMQDEENVGLALLAIVLRVKAGLHQSELLELLNDLNFADFAHIIGETPGFTAAREVDLHFADLATQTRWQTKYDMLIDRARNAPTRSVTQKSLDDRVSHFAASAQLVMTDLLLSDLTAMKCGTLEMRQMAMSLAESFKDDLFADNLQRKLDMLSELGAAFIGFQTKLKPSSAKELARGFGMSNYAFAADIAEALYRFTGVYDALGFGVPLFIERSVASVPKAVGRVSLGDSAEVVEKIAGGLLSGPQSLPQDQERYNQDSEAIIRDVKAFNGQWTLSAKQRRSVGAQQLETRLVQGRLPILGRSGISKSDALRVHDLLVELDKILAEPGGLTTAQTKIVMAITKQQEITAQLTKHKQEAQENHYTTGELPELLPFEQLLRWMSKEKDKVGALLFDTWPGRRNRFMPLFEKLETLWSELDDQTEPGGSTK